jgi:hypothetical protein
VSCGMSAPALLCTCQHRAAQPASSILPALYMPATSNLLALGPTRTLRRPHCRRIIKLITLLLRNAPCYQLTGNNTETNRQQATRRARAPRRTFLRSSTRPRAMFLLPRRWPGSARHCARYRCGPASQIRVGWEPNMGLGLRAVASVMCEPDGARPCRASRQRAHAVTNLSWRGPARSAVHASMRPWSSPDPTPPPKRVRRSRVPRGQDMQATPAVLSCFTDSSSAHPCQQRHRM